MQSMVYRMLKDELLHAYGRRRGHFTNRIGLGVLCAAGGAGFPTQKKRVCCEATQVVVRLIGRMFRRTKSGPKSGPSQH
jgi:hypothetical protein